MRTKTVAALMASAALMCLASPAQAELQGRDLDGDPTTFEAYYDTVLDITWLADANYASTSGIAWAGLMDWWAATAWVASLDYFGVTGWRLPKVVDSGAPGCAPYDCGFNRTSGELSHLWHVTLGNLALCAPDDSICEFVPQPGWASWANTGPFVNTYANERYFYGTEGEEPNNVFNFDPDIGWTSLVSKDEQRRVWPVHDGDVLPDTTPPAIQPSLPGTPGSNGWYISDVQVSWTVSDPDSAISETTGCDPASVTTDTTGITFTCSATSKGGTTTESVSIKRDATPPTVTATVGPPPNAFGWNRTNVTVTFTGTDATSGVEFCDPPVILKTNGTDQSASGRCHDFAGNQSELGMASGMNIDKTKPAVVITSPTSGAVYSVGQVVLAGYFCDDSLSGIVSCIGTVADGQPINTSKVSPVRSFKVTGKDAAGNATSVTVKYAVQ